MRPFRHRPAAASAAFVGALVGLLAILAVLPALPAAAAAAPQSPAAGAPPPAAGGRLETVPEPSLDGMETVVAEQLGAIREMVDQQIAAALPDTEPTRVDPTQLDPSVRAALTEAYGELGRHYQAYGLPRPAEIAYRNAALLSPRDLAWPYYLGVLAQDEGRLDEAAEHLATALALSPASLTIRVRLAEIRLTQGRPVEAAELARKALEVAPDAPSAHAQLGLAELALEHYPEAAEHLKSALAAVPGATRLRYPLGLAYRGMGEVDAARREIALRGEIGIRPPDPLLDEIEELKSGERVFILRGRQAYRAGDLESAVASFRQAVAARPDRVPARVDLAAVLAASGHRDEAIAELRRAIEIDPANATAHFNLGTLLAAAGQAAEGAGELRAATELRPGDAEAHLELAAALLQAGAPEPALSEYRRAGQLGAPGSAAIVGEANASTLLGRYSEATALLETAHESHPEDGLVARALARLLAACPDPALRDGERAVDLAERVVEAQPTVWNAETLAMAYAETGRCEEAVAWQKKAIAVTLEEGTPERVESMSRELTRYQRERPCRPPTGLAAGDGDAPP